VTIREASFPESDAHREKYAAQPPAGRIQSICLLQEKDEDS
jgi:hypothetical protein